MHYETIYFNLPSLHFIVNMYNKTKKRKKQKYAENVPVEFSFYTECQLVDRFQRIQAQ